MRDTPLTIVGNLTDDPELRFTASGIAVCKFTIASTPSYFDKTAQEWKDGEPTFLDCTAWRQLAENVAESLKRGVRVVAVGNLVTERWENDQGEKRSKMALQVHSLGAELSYATAQVRRMKRNGNPSDDEWNNATSERPPAQPAPEPAGVAAGPGPADVGEPPF